MKLLYGILLLVYAAVTILWIANSSYLFSLWGVILWFIATAIGLGVSIPKSKRTSILVKLVLFASSMMVILILVTIIISFTISSMP